MPSAMRAPTHPIQAADVQSADVQSADVQAADIHGSDLNGGDLDTKDGDAAVVAQLPPGHIFCQGCGDLVSTEGGCPDCVTCDRCESTVAEYTTRTVRGSTICDTCLYAWGWQCDECGGWNIDGADCGNGCADSDEHEDRSEGCCCEECLGRTEFGVVVHDADYQPRPVFHGTGPLFLGAEIEIEVLDDTEQCAQLAQEYLGDLGYLKTDGSLEHGLEIVTHPMSYAWALENFPWPMLTALEQEGCFTGDTTGIHVHLSRAGFSDSCHVYRWMKFVYRNERNVTALARRSSWSYAAFTDDDRRAVKDYAKGAYRQRYRAINTSNIDTFELRVFASSLDPDQVQAALGFAAASVEYTRELTVAAIARHDGWSWSAFVDWLSPQALYRPLSTELEALACAC